MRTFLIKTSSLSFYRTSAPTTARVKMAAQARARFIRKSCVGAFVPRIDRD
jgi:hypothetical protein